MKDFIFKPHLNAAVNFNSFESARYMHTNSDGDIGAGRNIAHSFNCTPRLSDMRLVDALILFRFAKTTNKLQ